jgi:hypothetical protein
MKPEKIIRALTPLLIIALLAAMFIPAVSAESFHKIKEDTTPIFAIKDDDIREAVKGVIIEIDNSDLEQKEKTQYITEFNEIISENPISKDKLKEALLKTGEALFSQKPPVTPKWAGFIHSDMARTAGNWMGLSDAECQVLFDHADDPDGSGTYCIDHYALTGAPEEAERLANLARGQYSINNRLLGAEFLANSMHYMTDMSVPFHYIYEYLANHQAYESYVSSQWGSGTTQNFNQSVTDNNYYYYITDVSDSAMNLAVYSHQYMSYIRNTMDTYSNWQDDPTLNQYTRNSIVEGAKYNMGLVDYATR